MNPTLDIATAWPRPLAVLALLVPAFAAYAGGTPMAPDPAAAAAPTPQCAPAECVDLSKLDKSCAVANPWICTAGPAIGGCFASQGDAGPPACTTACYYGSCATPASQAQTRTVTFTNQCADAFAVYQDATEVIAAADFPKGATESVTITLTAATNTWGETYYYSADAAGGYRGVNFRALPPDQDLSNSTLFEVTFGAYDGTADVYDLSAIPPSSCAGHMQKSENDFGFADHLPFKDPTDPTESWACLKKAGTGDVDPKTCGDGLANDLCPAVSADPTKGNAGTVQPPHASQSGNTVVYGCGVGKCCAAGSAPGSCDATTVTDCCPQVCAVTGSDDPTDPAVRNEVHLCAYQQSLLVASNLGLKTKAGTAPRQTGFWKPLAVSAVAAGGTVPASCRALNCKASAADPTLPDAASCGDGYLWPYDDLAATITCFAAPSYTVTFCPS